MIRGTKGGGILTLRSFRYALCASSAATRARILGMKLQVEDQDGAKLFSATVRAGSNRNTQVNSWGRSTSSLIERPKLRPDITAMSFT
jgi:hypothetical protein